MSNSPYDSTTSVTPVPLHTHDGGQNWHSGTLEQCQTTPTYPVRCNHVCSDHPPASQLKGES